MSNTKTLDEALDEVVEEIRSMSKEELKKQLSLSSNTEFARTVDQFAIREDLFEIKDEIEQLIEKRANFITSALIEVINSYTDVNLIPGLYSMYRLNCGIRKWTETTYPPNPDFVCSKTSLSWITVETDYIELTLTKHVDHWDECDEDFHWSYNKIPYLLGINGTREELIEFFTNLFSEQVQREEKRNNETKYSQLFNMDYDVVRKIISFPQPNNYNDFNEVLYNVGLNIERIKK